MSRNYRYLPWTVEECELLGHFIAQKTPYSEIARKLSRTAGAIQNQAHKLGLKSQLGRRPKVEERGYRTPSLPAIPQSKENFDD